MFVFGVYCNSGVIKYGFNMCCCYDNFVLFVFEWVCKGCDDVEFYFFGVFRYREYRRFIEFDVIYFDIIDCSF